MRLRYLFVLAMPMAGVARAQSIPVRVLVQSPAETRTALQIICLVQLDSTHPFHGALAELNDKLGGVLDRIRTPALFRGALGETLVITPPAGRIGATRLLVIGVGDAHTFTSDRMELVGSIVYREASRLGAVHPFFAPTLLDGGVTGFTTGEIAGQVLHGFWRAAGADSVLRGAGDAPHATVRDLTYLAGPQHAASTGQAIAQASAARAGH
jgi:hypothetical protein